MRLGMAAAQRVRNPGLSNGPAFDMPVALGAPLDPRLVFGRSSAASCYDATGTLQQTPANTPRVDYGPTPGGRTNWISNSTMQGASVGAPGTLPNGWGNFAANGIAMSVVGTGTVGGMPFVDVRFSGTATNTFFVEVFDLAVLAVSPGQVVTNSVYMALVGGSLAGVPSIALEHRPDAGSTTDTPVALTSTLTRFVSTATAAAGATVEYFSFLLVLTNGAAVDATIRFAGPQQEFGPTATAFIPTSGTPANVGAAPLGLLIEESRTNNVRNPRAEGAVAGTPGTMPTNWGATVGNGVASQIVGSGVEHGIPYVDIAFSGTPTATFGLQVFNDTAAPAAVGQTWTYSVYARAVAGTVPGGYVVGIQDTNSGGGSIGNSEAAQTLPSSAPLTTQRSSFTRTTATAGTAGARGYCYFVPQTGVPVSFTLRLGAPQLEQGAFPTSPILPPIGAPAATARAADVATLPTAGFLGAGAVGTLAADYQTIHGNAAAPEYAADICDGTANNRYALRIDAAGNQAAAGVIVSGGAAVIMPPAGSNVAGVPSKLAMAWAPGAQAASANGGAVQTAAAAAPAGSLNTMSIGTTGGGGSYANAYLRRVRYWPRALSAAELSGVTT